MENSKTDQNMGWNIIVAIFVSGILRTFYSEIIRYLLLSHIVICTQVTQSAIKRLHGLCPLVCLGIDIII